MNRFEQRSKDNYNKKAKNYDATFDGKFTVKFKNILANALEISKNSVLADIACGNGRLLNMLEAKGAFQGYGVDISDEMIEQAKILNPNMDFYVASCEQLPFEDNMIDIMTVCAAFHHFPDIEKFANEAERTIRQGGMIYIAEVYLPTILRVICNPFLKFSKAGDVKFYSPEEIASLFEKRGFSTETVTIDGMTQLVVLRKNVKVNFGGC